MKDKKRILFFAVVVLLLFALMMASLIKNKSSNSDNTVSNVSESDGYVISSSKNQHFSLIKTGDDIFTLVGQVTDGTHKQLATKVVAKDTGDNCGDQVLNITDEPFSYDITMPSDQTSVYFNLYYNEGRGIAISTNAINIVSDNGDWDFAKNENTDSNEKKLDISSPNDYKFTDEELLQVPQGFLTLSDTICNGHETDYEKAYAIYVWLCEHMYVAEEVSDTSLDYAFNTRIVDTKTYPSVFASLVRAQDIPCTIVETEEGYMFNQVYVNNGWINVQADRDTFNTYQSHRYNYDRKNLYTHFGAPTDIISANYVVSAVKK